MILSHRFTREFSRLSSQRLSQPGIEQCRGLPRVPNSTSRRQRASARPTSSSRRTSGHDHRSWTAALISFVVLIVSPDPELEGPVLVAPLRRAVENRVIAHQGTRHREPSRIGLVHSAVVEDECAEALPLGEVAVRSVPLELAFWSAIGGGPASSIGAIASRVCSSVRE